VRRRRGVDAPPPKKGEGRVNKRNRRGRGMKIGAVGEGGE
jgi:hypothetical protein